MKGIEPHRCRAPSRVLALALVAVGAIGATAGKSVEPGPRARPGDVELVVGVGDGRRDRIALEPDELVVLEEGEEVEVLAVEPLFVEPRVSQNGLATAPLSRKLWQLLLYVDPSVSRRTSLYWTLQALAARSDTLCATCHEASAIG